MTEYGQTIFLGAIAGAAGAGLAVSIWMLKCQAKVANGAPPLGNDAKAVQERLKYYGLSAAVGAAVGSVIGFYGFEAHWALYVMTLTSIGVGLAPGGFAKVIAGV